MNSKDLDQAALCLLANSAHPDQTAHLLCLPVVYKTSFARTKTFLFEAGRELHIGHLKTYPLSPGNS